jgi:phenylalanine-4-hydroxylase
MTQEYEKYTAQDLLVWQLLFDQQMQQLPGLASPAYLEGIEKVGFTRDRIPHFAEVNARLAQATGWRVEVVKGLIPNKEFFELLKNRQFPASTWLRKLDQLAYLEEPDMFHDVFGHVPLLSNQDFCDFLAGLSQVALRFIDSELAIELISRLYWYTVEFGLIQDQNGLKIYGAGILSSQGESVYCLGDQPQRVPFDVAQIVGTPYIKEKFQEKYFVVHSYRQLFDSLPELAQVIERHVIEEASLAIG